LQSTFERHLSPLPGQRTPVLQATRGIEFIAEAKVAKDGRRFISLPDSNRIYQEDWGYSLNTMGKDGHGSDTTRYHSICACGVTRDESARYIGTKSAEWPYSVQVTQMLLA